MNATNEQIKALLGQLPEEVPQEVLVQILQMFPDQMSFTLAQQMITEALKGISRDLPSDQIVAKAIDKLKNRAAAEKNEGPGSSKKITRDYFDSLLLEMRLMDSVVPDTEFQLYGETFSSPIMTAALSHLGTFNPDKPNLMMEYAKGAALANSVHWIGMGSNEEFDHVITSGARTIRIIKPYEDEDKIYSRIEHSEKAGALAVGMDLDHTFTKDGSIDIVFGEKMAIKSSASLSEYMHATRLPFVIKGILSVRDAVKCAEIGAKGIVISHHGGRLNYAVPPLLVLPEIVKEFGGEIPIFVDCGIVSGMDAYKALALGATAVSVGNHLIPFARKGGAQAVCDRMKAMTDELRGVMAYTGVKDVNSFDPTVIRRNLSDKSGT